MIHHNSAEFGKQSCEAILQYVHTMYYSKREKEASIFSPNTDERQD